MKLIKTGRPRAERGAVAIVTALVVSFVVLGMLALTIDVGGMTFERSQLQNAADASVMVLAQECAAGSPSCVDGNPQLEAKLQPLLNKNSYQDDRGQLAKAALSGGSPYPNGYCGRGLPGLAPCIAPNASAWKKLTSCPPLPQSLTTGRGASAPYVETYAMTQSSDGSNLLRTWFSTDVEATTHVTCARASWGSPGYGTPTLPLTTGYCDWSNATNGGTNFAPNPPNEIAPGKLWAIKVHDNNSKSSGVPVDPVKCGADKNGKYYPGGFGWTKTCFQLGFPSPECDGVAHDDKCTAAFDATGTIIIGDNGASPPKGCKDTALHDYVGHMVMVPIFTSISDSSYVIDGLAAFFVAGYQEVPSADPKSYNGGYVANPCVPSSSLCSDKDTAIYGWFTAPIVPVGNIDWGATPRGPATISPVG